MPYRRRATTTRRRRPHRTRNTYVRKVARSEAKKAIARTEETKYFDGRISATNPDYNGSSLSFVYNNATTTTISQGVGNHQYVGGSIKPTYIMFKATVLAADATNLVRFVIFQVRGSSAPATGELLQSVGNVCTPLSSYDPNYIDKVKVLADRVVAVSATNEFKKIKVFIPWKRLRRINFSDASGTVSAGAIYCYLYSDSGIASHPTVTAYWRLAYKDA